MRTSNESGLQPVSRRVWVEEGEQQLAIVNWKREWLWLYAFVQPQTGETKGVGSTLHQHARYLVGCSKILQGHFKVGKNKRIILPLDQAGWHMSQQLEVPEGIHLLPLPPYSPELQLALTLVAFGE